MEKSKIHIFIFLRLNYNIEIKPRDINSIIIILKNFKKEIIHYIRKIKFFYLNDISNKNLKILLNDLEKDMIILNNSILDNSILLPDLCFSDYFSNLVYLKIKKKYK